MSRAVVLCALLLVACGGSASGTPPASRTPAADSVSPVASDTEVPASASPSESIESEAASVSLPPPVSASVAEEDVARGERLCALVPQATVQAAVGRPVTTVTPGRDGCNWEIDAGAGGGVELRAESGTIDEGPRIAFPGGQDLTGIGQRAYYATDVSTLYFEHGGQLYAVQLVIIGDQTEAQEAQIARAIALAAIAAGL